MSSFTSTEADNGHEALFAFSDTMGLPASLRKRENVTLLGLLLILTLAYIALQSVRQRLSEKRAFERKKRLLGISFNASVSSSTSHAGNASAEVKGLGTAMSTGGIASICKHAWTLAQLLHLDSCVKYVQEVSPPSIKRLFGQKSQRRKDKAATSHDPVDSKTATKDSRGRAGTIASATRSSPSSSTSPGQTQKTTLSASSPAPNSPHTPAARQNARKQQSNNVHAGSSSSRSRAGTNIPKQQQRTPVAFGSPTLSQANQVVMKHVGIQVSHEDLLDLSMHSQADSRPRIPAQSQDSLQKDSKVRADMPAVMALPYNRSHSSQRADTHLRESAPDLAIACSVPLPAEDNDGNSTSTDSSVDATDAKLSRHATITKWNARGSARQHTSEQPARTEPSAPVPQLSAPPARRSDTKDSIQSPTCSSSGRSTSLSVSTDATGITSIRGEQESLPISSKLDIAPDLASTQMKTSPRQSQGMLQPAVDLDPPKDVPVADRRSESKPLKEAQLPKSASRPSLLSYSFHSGFQEPTTLEEGEIAEYAPMMSSPQQSRQARSKGLGDLDSDQDLYLPSPPDSQRKIQVDAMGYPSIPIPPILSSPNSSAYNSPSSASRAVSASRSAHSPSSSTLPQSPSNERKPINAQMHHELQSGTYPASLGVQSPSLYGYMPPSPQASGSAGYPAAFLGPPLASPQALSAVSSQQQQHIQHYIAQAQYQYQLQQQQQPAAIVNGQLHSHASQSASQPHSAPHPSALDPQPSPGFLNPTQMYMHRHRGAESSSGGSNRSSVHMTSTSQVSSRAPSPHPSSAHTHSTERNSSTGVSTAPTEEGNNAEAGFSQLSPHANGVTQSHHQQSQAQNQIELVQKMMLMQAHIQYAMHQNALQSQQQQFQSTAGFPASPASVGIPAVSYSTHGPSIPSPYMQSTSQQPFLLNGLPSPLATGPQPYAAQGGGQIPSVASPYQQYASSYQQSQPLAGPSASAGAVDNATPFPTVRRRQSTPALGADPSTQGFGNAHSSNNPSSFGNGRRRNRRNSRPFRMSSYGQMLDGPDYLTSPSHDTSAQYDAEVDMSTTSSSYNSSSRQHYDRRRSSLIPPPSLQLDSRKARRSRQRERERERLRQLELDDEEVTKNEDDIKADLDILAEMQAQEDKGIQANFNADEIMSRLKSMETVLERRGKELEIARWKLKCVEVDRKSIEEEHQKALAHFYERAERAEARLRLIDNATIAPTDGLQAKGSPEISVKKVQNPATSQGDGSVISDASQADNESVAASLSVSYSSTTPQRTHLADLYSPTSATSASYHFIDSPYTSSRYPPHPFASEYKLGRRGRRSPRNGKGTYRECNESGNNTLSPRGKDLALDSPATARARSAGGSEEPTSSESSDSEEDIEILLDAPHSRSPSIQPSVPHSRVPSGGMLGAALASSAMTESKTVGLGIESSSSSSDGTKSIRKTPVEFVGCLPSVTISQPPTSPAQKSDSAEEKP